MYVIITLLLLAAGIYPIYRCMEEVAQARRNQNAINKLLDFSPEPWDNVV